MLYRRNGGRIAAAAALAAFVLVLALGVGGRDMARAEGDWNDVILIYHTDCKGQIDPCG